jgi:hypothetical protein
VREFPYPEWEVPYQEALLETDKQMLKKKINIAEWKIFQRLQTISADANHHQERAAIEDALNNLLALKNNQLDYPDWKAK